MMVLDKKQAAHLLRHISQLSEVHGENVHRVRAFANAARVVERFDGDLAHAVASGQILEVKGVGKGTVAVLEALAAGTRPTALVELEQRTPAGLPDLLQVQGLGPKKVRTLWQQLGITGLGELEYACLENRLVDLPGFGAATQARVWDSLRFLLRNRQRHLIHDAWACHHNVAAALAAASGVDQVQLSGELRRGCETVGVVDLVVVGEDAAIEAALGPLLDGLGRNDGRVWTGTDSRGVACRVHAVPADELGAALLHTTGSNEHLDGLLERAAAAGLRLDAAGLWHSDERLEAETESSIYIALGLQPVPPELREGRDELELAAKHVLPSELVCLDDLRGALHNHTADSDGTASLEEMARAAQELGWSFLGIGDHSPAAHYANGLSAERLRDQWRRIDEWNQSNTGLRLVRGIEADILADGSLDLPEGCEAGLEYVVASVHSGFRNDEERQTERIIRAVSHPACRLLGHPTGRLLLARPGYAVDLEAVLTACAEHGVAVEINASPYRLDLDWRWARRALELGVALAINPDAHSTGGLADVRWGVTVARKAGARAQDIVNCSSIGPFLAE